MNFLNKVLLAIFFVLQMSKIECRFEFTNLKCASLDKSFVEFETCYIKAVNRSYKYITIKANVFDLPVYEAVTNFDVLKRNNHYLPFLYNITGPVCPFFENRKRYPVASFISGMFLQYSNFNHKCPFNHNFSLERLDIEFLNNRVTKLLPVPEGSYCLNASFFVKNINRANIQVFFTIS